MPLTLPNAIGPRAGTAPREDLPVFEITWNDPATGARGYLVIDRLVRGVSSGGLRMRPGCTLDEVRGLARGMTLKEAVNYEPDARYVPLGGAKGGIDFDPAHPQARTVLRRYLDAMRPLIERRWSMGEDLGLRQDAIDDVLGELGLSSSVQAVFPLLADVEAARARLDRACATDVDGVGLDELVGGYGVAEAVLAALTARGTDAAGTRAVVQGFGSMGGASARYLARAGVRVVGVADADGVVANPAGLDVERLLATRTPAGLVDRAALRPDDTCLPREEWLSVDAEVLVPAAVSYCVDESNHDRVRAGLVVEAANMPVTPGAEALLTARGVAVVPDFVANSATNAWWWWTLFGDVDGTAERSFAKISTRMRRMVGETFAHATARGTTPRQAALELAEQRLHQVTTRFGE
ncbi:Glu/Leu/Phe/Val dehydrogenase dimerization domain-containing protein [Saccharopolyspora rosea]|uniref:Glutamate dehydrogenase n=1 Tax=Saccharopolyspora rosea TaxID=524884 RepID=A0ABW3FYC6_9PSEU|nr:Glu/Leu/Phe/Val dehydrogenase dimerization domain-containing protein [Saccharopolyspora rosea]